MYNLSIFLEDSARRYPDRDALVLARPGAESIRLTYAQVDAMANRVANLLVELGVGRGDKVALTCPNLPQFPVIYYGILKAGAVVVPLNVLNKGREVAYYLDDSRAKVYFCFEGTAELPMAQMGHAAFGEVDSCEHFVVMTKDPAAASPIAGTPTLDALAEDGVLFEHAVSQVPLTWPSHTAILTGTYPFQNGVQDFTGQPLDPVHANRSPGDGSDAGGWLPLT